MFKLAIFIALILLIDHERYIRKESWRTWYGSPLWIIGIYNVFLKCVSSPHQPFLPLALFKGHALLSDHYATIRAEAMALIQKTQQTKEFGEVESFSKSISSPNWQCFLIKCYGQNTTKQAKITLPVTAALMQSQKQIRLAMLSILTPHASIPPHYGPSKACYRYHLTLWCDPSERAVIHINGQSYYWKEGEGVLFDDTYQHDVENNTDSVRVVLFCDVERNLSFPFNRLNRWLLTMAGRHHHLKHMEAQFNDDPPRSMQQGIESHHLNQ